jgi:hypothetical protein
MDFDEIRKSIIPDQQSILEMVDEYTLYCFYMDIDDLILGKVYPAPYRVDPIPSFSVFRSLGSGVEFWWKDHGKDESGNIFKLIQKIENLDTLEQVYQRINEDFGLNYNLPTLEKRDKIQLYGTPKESIIKIRVVETTFSSTGLSYWKNPFDIDKTLLDFYNTVQISCYWSYHDQEAPYSVPDPTFAYRTGKYYQIYSPFAPKLYKFRNDLPENYFFGYLQLPKTGNTLVIDKSSKDVIFCRRLGYYAVCGKSETTMIPSAKMLELKERFKDIYLMLDNDEAGKRQTEKYLSLYPWLKPRFINPELAKDKTDLCKRVGFEQAEQIIKQLIQ